MKTIAPKILAVPNYAWLDPNKLIFSSGRHFHLSPLAVQNVTTPLVSQYIHDVACQKLKRYVMYKTMLVLFFVDTVYSRVSIAIIRLCDSVCLSARYNQNG